MNSLIELSAVRAMHRQADEAASQLASIEGALATVDATTRDALNEWLSQRGAPVFRIGADEFELHWLRDVAADWHVAVELNAGMHRAILAIDGFAALDPLLVGEPFALMPPPLRDLAVHRLAARVLTHAPAALASTLELRTIHWEVGQLPDWQCRLPFALRRRPQGAQLIGCILFESGPGLQWLHGMLPIDRQSAHGRLGLSLPLRLSLGRSTIAAPSLHGLQAGDVVWIESASIARDGIAVDLIAPAARRSWRCRAQRQSLRIVAAGDRVGGPATGATHSAQHSFVLQDVTGAQTMDAQRWQVDVPVTFDIGELHLKLADLERLQPGHIIEFQQDVATATVALRIADRRIAEGTLIAVGKRLGVRIGTITARQEPGAA